MVVCFRLCAANYALIFSYINYFSSVCQLFWFLKCRKKKRKILTILGEVCYIFIQICCIYHRSTKSLIHSLAVTHKWRLSSQTRNQSYLTDDTPYFYIILFFNCLDCTFTLYIPMLVANWDVSWHSSLYYLSTSVAHWPMANHFTIYYAKQISYTLYKISYIRYAIS